VLIDLMRAKPELLKTELGMSAHRLALQKIKGTEWEDILFPKPISIEHARVLKDIRKAFLNEELERENQLLEQIEKQRRISLKYIANIKKEKRKNEEPSGEGA
jgi:hypothetical protein